MTEFTLIHTPNGDRLRITGSLPEGFHGEQDGSVWVCPLDAPNAAALRRALPWSAPVPVGARKSIGCGDRLGLATVGHVQAVREGDMFPVFAQQSIREMTRSRRSAQDVLDDATWGVFAADYRSGFGCDADHLKTIEDIDRCIDAGYMGFTLDPGAYVDNAAQTDGPATLREKYAALPWDALDTTPDALHERSIGTSPAGEISESDLVRAACKYGAALAEVTRLAQHIADRMAGQPYDLEVSVDETATPTSPQEHVVIATELLRLGVPFGGLAPRFVGRFEKGVDYIGDLDSFEADFALHAQIARALGPYKMSIHSGSDKFSLYPIIARHAGEHVHLKTAGTSWVEALRVIAMVDPDLFRAMLAYASERYPTDRASYHVSAEVSRLPSLNDDSALPDLMDQFDTRQIMHVTFGSLLDQFRDPLYAILRAHQDAYDAVLKRHFDRHIQPFNAGP